jgi:hypothetical protein
MFKVLTNKQWERIQKQLDEIRNIKHTVDQIFFSLNSFKIDYGIDQIERLNKELKDMQPARDKSLKRLQELCDSFN